MCVYTWTCHHWASAGWDFFMIARNFCEKNGTIHEKTSRFVMELSPSIVSIIH